MHQAFKNPAEAQAKNELIVFKKISLAPVEAFALFESNFLIPRPIAILEVHAAT